jgi:hypothetical protein
MKGARSRFVEIRFVVGASAPLMYTTNSFTDFGHTQMKSDIVVISWWSNCLGLACLHNPVEHTSGRNIYVVQVGKPEMQKERFRDYLPPTVEELPYPPDRRAEDWRVLETIARELLGDRQGLWFVDHDLFVQEDCEDWLAGMDRRFERSAVCLCHHSSVRGPSITIPAFWLSPVRFPPGMPSFARLPYREEPVASRPYALRQSGALMMPEKDTLVAAMEFLQEQGMVCGFPLTEGDRVLDGPAPFPRYRHIGGLYTFTGEVPPASLHDWIAHCVERFIAFYEAGPPEWASVEDPVLMQRLEEFRQAVSGDD